MQDRNSETFQVEVLKLCRQNQKLSRKQAKQRDAEITPSGCNGKTARKK